jgi:hypothetical protein
MLERMPQQYRGKDALGNDDDAAMTGPAFAPALTPKLNFDVRYAPQSDRLLRCREMTLWAISDILRRSKQ